MKRFLVIVPVLLAGCANRVQNAPTAPRVAARPSRPALKPTPTAPAPEFGEVRAMQLSRDGKLFATGTFKRGIAAMGFVTLRNASTNALIKRWEVPGGVMSLALSPDGTRLVAGQYESLSVWQVPSGRRLHQMKIDAQGGQFEVMCDFAPDGKTLAVASGELLLLDTTHWKPHRTPIHIEAPGFVDSAQFSPDGRFIATTHHDIDYGIRLWDTRTGRGRTLAQGDGGTIVFSRDSRLVAAQNSGGTRGTQVFSIPSGRSIGRMGDYNAAPSPLAFSPDGKKLIGLQVPDAFPQVWEIRSGEYVKTSLIHNVIALSPDGKYAFVVNEDASSIKKQRLDTKLF